MHSDSPHRCSALLATVLRIAFLGFPNVGKSSLINGLVGRKVVSVSRTPGHTRYFQTYFLTPSVKLCDCPGLIFPSLLPRQLQVCGRRGWSWVGRRRGWACTRCSMLFPQVLAGIYPIAQIQEPYTSVGYLASRIPVQALLHLRHPEAEDPSAEHPWCAWDICEGGLHGLSLLFLAYLVLEFYQLKFWPQGGSCLLAPKFLYSATIKNFCLDCVEYWKD